MAYHSGRKVVVSNIIGNVLMLLVLIVVMAAVPGTVKAEGQNNGRQADGSWITEASLISGYGDAFIDEGGYRTLLMMVHLGKDIAHFIPALNGHRGTLSLFLEPQFNYVLKPAGEIEFGMGIGFQYAYPVTEGISPYLLVVSGPQYISVDSTKQANGLNFASAVGAGIYFFLTKNTALNLGYRYRHVSNASTKRPNGGIDSEIGILGLSHFF